MINDDVIKKIGSYWDDYSEKFDEEHDTENIDVWKDYLASILGEDKNKSYEEIYDKYINQLIGMYKIIS